MTNLGEVIGTTHGLVGPHGWQAPEQVYVRRTEDPDRPVAIEGWRGYTVAQRMALTRGQLRELRDVLSLALETEGERFCAPHGWGWSENVPGCMWCVPVEQRDDQWRETYFTGGRIEA